jgi:crossover junction endodeoxyribonuclease RuvC
MATEKMKPPAYLGIDPGKTGAACLISVALPEPLFCDWPRSNTPQEAYAVLHRWKQDYHIVLAILEKVGAMPGQGVSSMFTFGHNAGLWEGLLIGLKIPYQRLMPAAWRKGLIVGARGSGGDPKAQARQAARALFPGAELTGPRGAFLHGRADALLMAERARRITVG